MLREEDREFRDLFKELAEYEKYGVRITMDGEQASPMQVVKAHMVKEDSIYARNYVKDENGRLKELKFQNMREKDWEDYTPQDT